MIGTWVARFVHGAKTSRRVTLYHLVESEIADRKVTRCGRELGDRDPDSSLLSAESVGLTAPPPVGDRCHYCRGAT